MSENNRFMIGLDHEIVFSEFNGDTFIRLIIIIDETDLKIGNLWKMIKNLVFINIFFL